MPLNEPNCTLSYFNELIMRKDSDQDSTWRPFTSNFNFYQYAIKHLPYHQFIYLNLWSFFQL